jgi:Protein of unknown function (DUF3617)
MSVIKALSRILVVGILVVFVSRSARLQAAERMTTGQWEFTMTMKGASHSSKSCVTPDLAAVANGDSRTGREAAEKNAAKSKSPCTVTDFTAEGDTVSYTLTCGDRTIRSTATHHGDRYEGVLKTKTATEETTTEVKARRLGACPK